MSTPTQNGDSHCTNFCTYLQKYKCWCAPRPAAQKIIGLHVNDVGLPRCQALCDIFGEGEVTQNVLPLLLPLHPIAQTVSYNFFIVPRAKLRWLAERVMKNRHLGVQIDLTCVCQTQSALKARALNVQTV